MIEKVRYQGTEQVADLTPQMMKARTFETLTQLNFRANQRQPLVRGIEDTHWIDDTSAEYVASIVERLAGVPTLPLCTYRPDYQPDWMDKSYATRLTLTSLSAHDSLHIVQAALQEEQVPDVLVQASLAKAEGSPFFLEELAQTVTQQGELGASVVLIEAIQGVIMARIDALGGNLYHLGSFASARTHLEHAWPGALPSAAAIQPSRPTAE